MERILCISPCSMNPNPVPILSIVIQDDKESCTCILVPTLHHESRTYCERGRKVFFLERGMCVTVAVIRFIIIVRGEVKSLQGSAKWNRAALIGNFRISGITPHLGLGGSIGIPTEVVISHVGETVLMRLCVRPSLTWDSVNCDVCFSNIVAA